jgi:hypothetical protein
VCGRTHRIVELYRRHKKTVIDESQSDSKLIGRLPITNPIYPIWLSRPAFLMSFLFCLRLPRRIIRLRLTLHLLLPACLPRVAAPRHGIRLALHAQLLLPARLSRVPAPGHGLGGAFDLFFPACLSWVSAPGHGLGVGFRFRFGHGQGHGGGRQEGGGGGEGQLHGWIDCFAGLQGLLGRSLLGGNFCLRGGLLTGTDIKIGTR